MFVCTFSSLEKLRFRRFVGLKNRKKAETRETKRYKRENNYKKKKNIGEQDIKNKKI